MSMSRLRENNSAYSSLMPTSMNLVSANVLKRSRLLSKVVPSTKVNGSKLKLMLGKVVALKFGPMAPCTRATGSRAKQLEKVD